MAFWFTDRKSAFTDFKEDNVVIGTDLNIFPTMKFNWKGLIIWYFIFDFINDPLRDLLLTGSTDYFEIFNVFNNLLVFVSGHFSFFLFGAIAYAGFYFFFPKRNYLLCFLFIVLAFIVPIGVRYLIQEMFFDIAFGFTNYRKGVELSYYFNDNLYFAFRYVIFGVVYYFVQLSYYKELQGKELAIENQKMQLSLLRSQINPHFLLNSLNNIYALVYHKSEGALDALGTLSGLLKYSLYENKEMVLLSLEIAHVTKVIELNRLRFDYPIVVKTDIDEQLMDQLIPPFIIIPLIENAFKHGNLKDATRPISWSVNRVEEGLLIKVSNKKGKHEKDSVGGIGLENIKKRLALIYPEKHNFQIDETDDTFSVTLLIPTDD